MLFSNIHQRHASGYLTNTHQRTANEYVIQGISRRIKKKKNSGYKLTAVESHFSRSSMRRGCFGPSLFRCATELLAALLRPFALVLLVAFLIAAEGRTSAWFITGPAEGYTLDDYPLPEEAITAIEEEHATVEKVSFNLREYHADAYERDSLVKFISGVIAVYYPSIDDAGLIASHIVQLSEEAKVDPLYISSVIAMESGFRTSARSKVGALGLMQVMPRTAQEVAGSTTTPALNDPETNIRLGIAYLKQLEQQYRGNRFQALAAYNWGPGNLSKARAANKKVPGMVRKYAVGILERTVRWQKHFNGAKRASESVRKHSEIQSAAAPRQTSAT